MSTFLSRVGSGAHEGAWRGKQILQCPGREVQGPCKESHSLVWAGLHPHQLQVESVDIVTLEEDGDRCCPAVSIDTPAKSISTRSFRCGLFPVSCISSFLSHPRSWPGLPLPTWLKEFSNITVGPWQPLIQTSEAPLAWGRRPTAEPDTHRFVRLPPHSPCCLCQPFAIMPS